MNPMFCRTYTFSLGIIAVLLSGCLPGGDKKQGLNNKHRVIVSSDIGGTDPDDFQSMIHYLMYADKFQTEGLIASPYGDGRIGDIYKIIDLYENDYSKLNGNSDYPEPRMLRSVVKQGAVAAAPPKGWGDTTEGSQWIIDRAKSDNERPLWILVWGGIEDVAQALHDAPEIVNNIRVYWIGGPNKKWSVNAYLYIARKFPDLWMIEANSTYRGWFIDTDQKEELSNKVFHDTFIKGHGALGRDFGNYYRGEIKMGDTPSVAYLLHGDPDNPEGESWGGSFAPLHYSAVRIFERNTVLTDYVPTYSVVEWSMHVSGTVHEEDPTIWMEIDGQRIDGFYEGNGFFRIRFVPKRPGKWAYTIHSPIKELNGKTGEFTSVNPWPGEQHVENIKPINKWWTDKQDEDTYLGPYQGAKTIAKWREAYLMDWAERLSWLAE